MEILNEINEDPVIEKNHEEIDLVLKRISKLKITQYDRAVKILRFY